MKAFAPSVALALTLLCGVSAFAQDSAPSATPTPQEEEAEGPPTLAVLPLRFATEALLDRGDHAALIRTWASGTAMTSKLTGELVQTRRFRVVERERVDAILLELNLGEQGLADPKQLPKGKVLAARYLLAGEVSALRVDVQTRPIPYGEGRTARRVELKLALGLRVIDSLTSQLVLAEPFQIELVEPLASGSGIPNDLWDRAQAKLCQKLRIAVVDAVFPILLLRLEGTEFVIDRGQRHGVVKGDRLDVIAGTGERRKLGEIEVTGVGPSESRARVLSGSGMAPGDECRRHPRSPDKVPGPTSRPKPEGW